MAKFLVTDNQGRKFVVDAADGATQDQVMAELGTWNQDQLDTAYKANQPEDTGPNLLQATLAAFPGTAPISNILTPDLVTEAYKGGARAFSDIIHNIPEKFSLQQNAENVQLNGQMANIYNQIDAGKKASDVAPAFPAAAPELGMDPTAMQKNIVNSYAQQYQDASPAGRKKLRESLSNQTQDAAEKIISDVASLDKWQRENKWSEPATANLEDINSIATANQWLGGTMGSGTVYSLPALLGARVGGVTGAGLALGSSAGMNFSQEISNRLAAITQQTEGLPDDQKVAVISDYLNKSGAVSKGSAFVQGLLDMAGPVGSALRGAIVKKATGEAAETIVGNALKQRLTELPRELAEEGITGAAQQFTSIAGQKQLGEYKPNLFSLETLRQSAEAGLAEATGALGLSGVQTAMDVYNTARNSGNQQAIDKATQQLQQSLHMEGNDPETMRQLVDRLYSEQKTKGLSDADAMKAAGEELYRTTQQKAQENADFNVPTNNGVNPTGLGESISSAGREVGQGGTPGQATEAETGGLDGNRNVVPSNVETEGTRNNPLDQLNDTRKQQQNYQKAQAAQQKAQENNTELATTHQQVLSKDALGLSTAELTGNLQERKTQAQELVTEAANSKWFGDLNITPNKLLQAKNILAQGGQPSAAHAIQSVLNEQQNKDFNAKVIDALNKKQSAQPVQPEQTKPTLEQTAAHEDTAFEQALNRLVNVSGWTEDGQQNPENKQISNEDAQQIYDNIEARNKPPEEIHQDIDAAQQAYAQQQGAKPTGQYAPVIQNVNHAAVNNEITPQEHELFMNAASAGKMPPERIMEELNKARSRGGAAQPMTITGGGSNQLPPAPPSQPPSGGGEGPTGPKPKKVANVPQVVQRTRNAIKMGGMNSGHEDFSAYSNTGDRAKALAQSGIDKVLALSYGALPSRDIIRLATEKYVPLGNKLRVVDSALKQIITDRNQMRAESQPKIDDWAKFKAQHVEGGNVLDQLINYATLQDIDPRRAGDPNSFVQQDAEMNDPKTSTQAKNARRMYINDIYDLWNKLAQKDNGDKKGQELFNTAIEEYRKLFDSQYLTVMAGIEHSGLSEERKAQAAEHMKKLYDDARQIGLYAPLMRFGNYTLSYGTGNKRAFLMFDTAAARNEARMQLSRFLADQPRETKSAQTIYDEIVPGEHNDAQAARDYAVSNAPSELIKRIFQDLDETTIPDVDALKDAVFQMYLQALPRGALAKQFLGRKGIPGFDTDALRVFSATSGQAINRLARMNNEKDARRALMEAYALTADHPQRDRLRQYVDEMLLRTTDMVQSKSRDTVLDNVVNFGVRGAFLWFLSSAKTAAAQLTQLPIVAFPYLIGDYGAGPTSKVLAQYQFLPTRWSMAKFDTKGNQIANYGQPTIGDSDYVRRNPNKQKRDLLTSAWKAFENSDAHIGTFTGSIIDRSRMPTSKYESTMQKTSRGAVKVLTAPVHHMERGIREITYMSNIELEYNKLRKEGVGHEMAKQMAIDKSFDTVYETTFDYSKPGKPRYFTSPIGRMTFQFFNYPMQLYLNNVRAFYNWVKPIQSYEARKKAAIQFWGSTGMIAAFAGLTNTPAFAGASITMGFLSGLAHAMKLALGHGDDPDDPENPLFAPDFKLWFEEYFLKKMLASGGTIPELFNIPDDVADKTFQSAVSGPVSALSGMDIGSSVGTSLFSFNNFKQEDSTKSMVLNNLMDLGGGAPISWLEQIMDGVDEIGAGNTERGIEKLSPALIRNPLKAYRFGKEGSRSYDYDPIKEKEFFTTSKLIAQAIGFPDTGYNREQKITYAYKTADARLKNQKENLLGLLGRETKRMIVNGDPAGMYSAHQNIIEFNNKHPESPITDDQINGSIKSQIESGQKAIRGVNFTQDQIENEYRAQQNYTIPPP